MPKLPEQKRFVDLSDYGRSFGRWLAVSLKDTWVSPLHLTGLFVVAGLLAWYCILADRPFLACMLLILKSAIDAADGELARIRETPSYIGRYADSIADNLLNLLFIITLGQVYDHPLWVSAVAYFLLQMQGTVYNYYYVIVRNIRNGDRTSQVFEITPPKALRGESQKVVTRLHYCYVFLYGIYDKIMYTLDPHAPKADDIPNGFMSSVSIFGLGFQLLFIGIMLVIDLGHLIIPTIIAISPLILVFVWIRRNILK